MTTNDRRYHDRFRAAAIKIHFKPASFMRYCLSTRTAIGVDFSKSGMSFQSPHRMKPGHRLCMSLTNRFLHLQTLPAEVIYQQEHGDYFEYGVRFLFEDLNSHARISVAHMIQQFENQLRKEQGLDEEAHQQAG